MKELYNQGENKLNPFSRLQEKEEWQIQMSLYRRIEDELYWPLYGYPDSLIDQLTVFLMKDIE